MDDSFSFGEPAKKWSGSKVPPKAPARHAGERTRPSFGPMIGIVAGGIAIVLVVAFLMLMRSGGQTAAGAEVTAVQQIGHADDVEARSNLQSAAMTAMTLRAEAGDFTAADATAMATAEPSFTYTTSASTGASVVSVAATATDWAAAVSSGSGTCVYVHIGASGSPTYGSGSVCTGQAAMSA
jgi:hypothetical protein